jgi:hypothetical protein
MEMTLPQTDRFFKLVCDKNIIGYYNNKERAKAERELLLAKHPEMGHIALLRGPDHWKGESGE